ncbi:MAG: FRG domain-containing protein [Phycisphaerales bacterium]
MADTSWTAAQTLDWPAYKQWAGRFADVPQEQRERFIFRGHGDSNWLLKPSLDRGVPFVSLDERSRRLRALIEEFVHECEALPSKPSLPEGEVAQECLARHHGMPSSLLDWTRSPYIAAFFAFADPHRGAESVEVLALDRSMLPDDAPLEFLVERRLVRLNPRGIAQQAVFVRVEDQSQRLDEVLRCALHRVRLLSAETARSLADLDLMGINERTMYADVGGAAKAAARRVLR